MFSRMHVPDKFSGSIKFDNVVFYYPTGAFNYTSIRCIMIPASTAPGMLIYYIACITCG